jgi:serine acetyltransferase
VRIPLSQSIDADLCIYRRLRYPHAQARWQWVVLWLTSPGLLALLTQRLYRQASAIRAQRGWTTRALALRICAALGRLLTLPLAKSDLQESTDFAGGVYLSDLGNLVIGARSVGKGTIIHHRVTIGMNLMDRGKPSIGENVWIGPDCVLYGRIEVGDGATILPQTVLTRSIPAKAVVRGNPPRLVRLDFDNCELRKSLAWDIEIGAAEPR